MERELLLAIDEETNWVHISQSGPTRNTAEAWQALVTQPIYLANVTKSEKAIAKLYRALK